MKKFLNGCLFLVFLLPLHYVNAQSTNGGSTPSGRENWFPNVGNVGIGTRTPSEALHVIGSVRVTESLFTNNLETVGLRATSLNILEDVSIGRHLYVGGNTGLGVTGATERLEVGGNLKVNNNIFGKEKLIVDGYTGLGLSDPTERLHVNGNIKVSHTIYTGEGLIVNGKTGLGVTSPTERLEVAGNIKSSGDVVSVNVRADKGYFKSIETEGTLAVNGNVGIGVAPGNDKLTVGGDTYINGLLTTENLTVKQKLDLKGTFSLAGVMGVGVANPEATLHVNGDGRFDGDLRANKIIVNAIEIAGATGEPDGNPSSVTFGDNMFINGSVGIGTNKIEGYRLSVDGKIRAGDDIKVYSSTEWSDYVFEKGYDLMPLSDVEKFIKANGHLPHIPSAAQVAKDGVNLVEMDANLLRKIEELTLYMIQMKNENEALRKELAAIKSKKN